MRLQTTLVRATVDAVGVPRGSLGTVWDEPRRGVFLVKWLEPIPPGGGRTEPDGYEAPGGMCEVPESALIGVGLVIVDAPQVPDSEAAGRLWVPGR